MRPPASTKWRCQYTVGSLSRAARAMIRLRCTTAAPLAVMISPPFGEPANAATVRSISAGSRTSIGVTFILKYGATAWIAPNCPLPEGTAGLRTTPARVTLGAICFSTSSHFPLTPYSLVEKPVALPPGFPQAFDIAAADRISDLDEHDRYGARDL